MIWLPLLAFLLIFSIIKSPGSSNMPSLPSGEVLFFNKLASFQRGQFVLLYPPKNAPQALSAFGIRVRFIKRILGVPGDRLWMCKGRFWLNGKQLEESYTIPYWVKDDNWDNSSYLASSDTWIFWDNLDLSPRNTTEASCKAYSILLKSDEYFVVGDNRSPGGSEDSRVFGAVKKADILGALWWASFPPRTLEIPEELK